MTHVLKSIGISEITDVSDSSKALKIDLASATTDTSLTVVLGQSTNRTWTVPNASSTFQGIDLAQTVTNKTLTSNTNNLIARGLWFGAGSASVSTYASNAPTAGQVLTATNSTTVGWQTPSTGVSSHSGLTGLGADDHTQYALLAGRSGGQTLIGGTASGNNLTLSSTSNATKGFVQTADPVRITNTTVTTSPSTGSLVLTAGLGVGGTIEAGNYIKGDNVFARSAGSSQANPALFGFEMMMSGQANRFQFGDSANFWQNGFGARQTMGSYWGIELRGNRRTTTASAFVDGTNGDPSISIINENNTVALKVIFKNGRQMRAQISGQSQIRESWMSQQTIESTVSVYQVQCKHLQIKP
jgi:hypothetical protein